MAIVHGRIVATSAHYAVTDMMSALGRERNSGNEKTSPSDPVAAAQQGFW